MRLCLNWQSILSFVVIPYDTQVQGLVSIVVNCTTKNAGIYCCPFCDLGLPQPSQ